MRESLARDSNVAGPAGGEARGTEMSEPEQVIDVDAIYIRPRPGGWSMEVAGETRDFATATGAIFEGIQQGRALARSGREVWVMWRNGEAWSVAWTSNG